MGEEVAHFKVLMKTHSAAALGSPGVEPTGEIKVREIEAYASVADLIHAAILANSGAASLKEVSLELFIVNLHILLLQLSKILCLFRYADL